MSYLRTMVAALVLVLGTVCPSASNDAYPTRTIKLVVPFPPGGTTDIVGRVLAQKLAVAFGGTVIVENKSGAGGMVGTDSVARSAPDGYTLLLGNSGALATALQLFPSVPYNVVRDFAPISIISDVDIVLAVNPEIPAKTVSELINYARKNPGKLNVAIPSVGSMHHLITESFKLAAGIEVTTVPYKGSAPAIVDLIGGQVQIDFDNLPALAPYLSSGKVRGLAVASVARSPYCPDLPTMAEVGYPDIVASPWFALVAPAGTPHPIIERLNQEIVKIMQSEDMKKRLHDQGANARWSTPEESAAFIRGEIDRWAKVVKTSGAKMQ